MSESGASKPGFAVRHKGTIALVGGLVAVLAGSAAGYGLGYEEQAIASGLISLFVFGAAVAVPGPVSYPAAITIGLIATVGLLLAGVTSGHPVAAGLAMGFTSMLTSLSKAGGKTAFAVGIVLGTAYFLPAALGVVQGIDEGEIAELGLAGILVGLVLVLVVSNLRRVIGGQPPTSGESEANPSADRQPALKLMWKELRDLGPDARAGIRRGLLLGVAMGLYQINADHNLFWIMITMNIVLLPDLAGTWDKALTRSLGAIAGALLVGVLSMVLPASIVIGIGVLAAVVGISYYRRNYTVYAACVSFLAVAIYGADTGSFWTWAGLRAGDTVIGATIAIVSAYVIFPVRAPRDP